MTKNNNTGRFTSGNWNEYNVNTLTSIHWRASLVPAAAVIPAPIAYIKVVAVKKLVVGFLGGIQSVHHVRALRIPSILLLTVLGPRPVRGSDILP